MNRSQRIAIWVLTLIGLLAAWKLFGQGFGNFRTDQPFLARNYTTSAVDPNDPSTISGLAWRWVGSDLQTTQTNAQVVAWLDRIQANVLTNGDAGSRPTNSLNNAVYFNGTQFFTNTTVITNINGGPLSWYVILNRTNNALIAYLLKTASGRGFNLRLGVDLSDGVGTAHFALGAGTSYPLIGGPIPTNTIVDLIGATTNGAVDDIIRFYTNGLYAGTLAPLVYDNWQIVGVGSKNDTTTSQMFEGYIYEICIWTNSLTTNNAYTLYQYRTNKYGF